MSDPSKRQAVLRELREELGPEFDPERFSASSWDSWEIVTACIQLDGMHDLVEVLSLLGGQTREWQAFSEVVAEVFPQRLLSAADRRHLEQVLREVPADVLQLGVSAVVAHEDWDRGVASSGGFAETLDGLVRVRAGASKDGYLLWVLLEAVAHACDETLWQELHLAINLAAAMLGDRAQEAARRACSEQAARLVSERDPSVVEAAPDSGDIVSLVPASESGEGVIADTVAALVPTAALTPVPAVWGGVPPKNAYFTGREDTLDILKRTLRPHAKTSLLPQTLHGLGGVGKTQVAVEFAHRCRADYDLVWWIPAEDERSIRRSIVSLARKLGLPEADDQQFIIDSALDELRLSRTHLRWLVVFDNATEPEIVRPYLPNGAGHVLITSRSRSWIGSSSVVEVDVFRPEESVEFLTSRWRGLSEQDALDLAEHLGHLPLALAQAVAVHEQTGMPLAEYLRNFQASPAQMLGVSVPTDYQLPVAKTWRLAFEELHKRSPAAAQLLQICAFLSSQPIYVPMLREGRGAQLPSPLDATILDELGFRKAVQEIGKFALAQLDSGRDFLTIHMLVRAVLRDGLVQEQRIQVERSAHSVLALANPGSPDRGDYWSRHAHVAPHVVPSGVIHSEDPHVRQIVVDQIRYYFAIGDFAASASLARRAVEDWRGRLGADDVMTLRANFHLGNALRVLGEYAEAREVTLETFQQLKRIYGADHEYTLQIANSVTVDLRLLGQFDRALELDEENLRRHRAVLGNDDLSTLRAANNLAIDYRLAGRFSEARELDEDTVRRRGVIDPGGTNPETLGSINNLVRDLYGLGSYAEALALQTEHLSALGSRLRANHRFILLARRNIAILQRKVGDHVHALRQAESDYEVTCNQLGQQHEYSLAAATTLVNALRAGGHDLARAVDLGEETRTGYQERFGAEHPVSLACAVNLAIVYRAVGDLEKATQLDAQTLPVLRRVLGDEHPYTMCCAANTTNNLAALGKASEARAISLDLVARSRRSRGDRHPYTLACSANLALDLDAVGEHAEATKVRGETLQLMRERLGSEHPQTVSVERSRRTEADVEVPPM